MSGTSAQETDGPMIIRHQEGEDQQHEARNRQENGEESEHHDHRGNDADRRYRRDRLVRSSTHSAANMSPMEVVAPEATIGSTVPRNATTVVWPMPMQFFPIAADEEEVIVGPCAEDQAPSRCLGFWPLRTTTCIVSEDVDERARRRQRDTRGNERDEPEEGTAVDEDEDDRDHECGCDEQGGVDGPEDFDEIGEEATRSCDVHLKVGVGGSRFIVLDDSRKAISPLSRSADPRSPLTTLIETASPSSDGIGIGRTGSRYAEDLVSVWHLQIGSLLNEFARWLVDPPVNWPPSGFGHHDQKRDGRAVGELGLLLGDER